MRITLNPVSNPEFGKIEITGPVFAVGRNEPPFSHYPQPIRDQLAARHARIFTESGEIYLVSLSTTAVNDRACRNKPEKLRSGDKLCFADRLTYRVEMSSAGDEDTCISSTAGPPVILTLLPERAESGLDSIVISKFPFLVSKVSGVFSEYKEQRFAEGLKFLSRRHACIFLREDKVYLEDLNSTNGTYVAGERLGEEARPLKDGDVISFGQELFVYRVSIIAPAMEQQTQLQYAAMPMSAAPVHARTTFIECPSSFLEIYCDQGEVADKAAAITGSDAKKALEASNEAGFWQGPRRRLRFYMSGLARRLSKAMPLPPQVIELFREIRERARHQRASRRKTAWRLSVIGILLLALMGYGIHWFMGSPEREISALIETGQYETAAKRADEYLRTHPEDDEFGELAAEAMLKHLIPRWMKNLEGRRYDEAQALVAKARGAVSGPNPAVLNLLEVVAWVGELERYMARRDGRMQLMIYRDEASIERLLDRWEDDSNGHRRNLAKIVFYVPEFESLRTRTFSHLRALRDYRDSYVAEMDELKGAIADRLQQSRPEELVQILHDFADRYPAIGGIQALKQDLNHYIRLTKALEKKDLKRISRLLDEIRFQTPPFKNKVEEVKRTALPPPEILAKYRQSSKSWRSGDIETALALLKGLTGQPWGEVAEEHLTRCQKIVSEFNALKTAKAAREGYEERLVRFYKMLDLDEDTYFFRSIESDFKAYRDKVLAETASIFQLAKQHWQDYQNNGGIRGMLRLEGTISDAFRRQAALLSQAYKYIDRVDGVYRSLDVPLPEEYAKLRHAVITEVRVQRRSLEDLRAVLESYLLGEKLKLIVEPREPGV